MYGMQRGYQISSWQLLVGNWHFIAGGYKLLVGKKHSTKFAGMLAANSKLQTMVSRSLHYATFQYTLVNIVLYL